MPVKWKAPHRPKGKVSQTFNDGLLSVYGVTDAAAPGHKPVKQRTLKVTLAFDERRVGVERFYRSAQAQARIERVLRVPAGAQRIATPAGTAADAVSKSDTAIKAQDLVTVTGSDLLYCVELVQTVPDVYPASLDLSLSCVDQDAPTAGGAGNV